MDRDAISLVFKMPVHESAVIQRIQDILGTTSDDVASAVRNLSDDEYNRLCSLVMQRFLSSKQARKACNIVGITPPDMSLGEILRVKGLPEYLNLPPITQQLSENRSLDAIIKYSLQFSRDNKAVSRVVLHLLYRVMQENGYEWPFMLEYSGEVLDINSNANISIEGVKLPKPGTFSPALKKQIEEWKDNEMSLNRIEKLANKTLPDFVRSSLVANMSPTMRSKLKKISKVSELDSMSQEPGLESLKNAIKGYI